MLPHLFSSSSYKFYRLDFFGSLHNILFCSYKFEYVLPLPLSSFALMKVYRISVLVRSFQLKLIMNDEDPGYTTTGIYFGSEAILRMRNMLEDWQKMKQKYEIMKLQRSLTRLEGKLP